MISVSEQVKFIHNKRGAVTTVPVTVEFGKLFNSSTLADKESLFPSEISGTEELLHSVVTLYLDCLPEVPLESLYRILYDNNRKEIAKETIVSKNGSESDENNNEDDVDSALASPSPTSPRSPEGPESLGSDQTPLKPFPDKTTSSEDMESPGYQSCGDYNVEEEEEENGPEALEGQERGANCFQRMSRGLISPGKGHPEEGYSDGENGRATEPVANCGPYSGPINGKSNKAHNQRPLNLNTSGTPSSPSSSPFTRRMAFSQSKAMRASPSPSASSCDGSSTETSESEGDSESATEGKAAHGVYDILAKRYTLFLKEFEKYKRRRGTSRGYGGDFQSHHEIGIIDRLVACATYYKSYSLPGIKVTLVPLLSVLRRYRKCGVGGFIIERLKLPSVVGPYDALVLKAASKTRNFFRGCGFTDDLIVNSRFKPTVSGHLSKWVKNNRRQNVQMAYIPPFGRNYPFFPGSSASSGLSSTTSSSSSSNRNRSTSIRAMDEDIGVWREKSLEAYQAHYLLALRMKEEIKKLYTEVYKRDQRILQLNHENKSLRKQLNRKEAQASLSFIDAIDKETHELEFLYNRCKDYISQI